MASVVMPLFKRRTVTGWAVNPDAPRGYFAGEQDPDADAGVGLLTVNAVPGSRWVEVWHKPSLTSPPKTLVSYVFSGPDGTWQAPDMPSEEWYRIIATDHAGVYESVIIDDVLPYVPA